MMRTLLLSILLLSFTATGQELFFSNLNSSVQLPSQESYKVLQDDEGYIWFSTDKGVCRYSSGHLKIFDRSNGLPEESVYVIEKDASGRVWFITAQNRILYYEEGKLKEAPFSREFSGMDRDNSGAAYVTYGMNLDDPEKMEVFGAMNSYTIFRSNGRIVKNKKNYNSALQLKRPSSFGRYINGIITIGRIDKVSMEIVRNGKSQMVQFNDFNSADVSSRTICTARAYDRDVVSIANRVVVFRDDLSYETLKFPSDVLSVTADANNGIWVGVRNFGLYYYSDIRTGKWTHHSLRDFSVTDIALDNENGVWCSTLEQGVFYCSNRNIESYINDGFGKRLTKIKSVNGRLFLAISDQLLYYTDGKFEDFRKGHHYLHVHDIYYYRKKWYTCGLSFLTRTDSKGRHEDFTVQEQGYIVFRGAGTSFAESDGRLFVGMHTGLAEIDKTLMMKYLKKPFARLANHVIADGKGNLLLGSKEGVYSYDIQTKGTTLVSSEVTDVIRFVKDPSGIIWIATKNEGIFIYENGEIKRAPGVDGLEGVRFFDIDADREGNIWAASNRGIFCFKKSNGNYQKLNYNVANGLPSSEVYKIGCHEGQVWFSVFEGLFCITDPALMNNVILPRIRIRSANIGKKRLKNIRSVYVEDHQQILTLGFDFLSYKDQSANRLHYELVNSSGDTVSATVPGDQISFNGLDPGSYKLIVKGVCFDGSRSEIPEILTITVARPYYLTWWFIAGCIILLIILFLLVLRYFANRIRRREKAKTEINKRLAEFQMTALQAQMNPHFIFNAINTIQGYILQRDEEEAYKYLSKFSKLIRIVLHHSREKELLLSDELEMLNLYIELEQLRFDHSFDFELKIAEDIDPESTYLPGMLLQPYIENAVWHGLVNLQNERRGKLILRFEREESCLKVIIEDNGIGRAKAKDYRKNTSHKSVSMDLTAERIQLMKSIYDFDHESIQISDKTDADNQSAGTIVVLRIPNIL